MGHPSTEPARSNNERLSSPPEQRQANELRRGLSTASALGLNVIDMVGSRPIGDAALDRRGDGRPAGNIGMFRVIMVLIALAALASVFALLLGYSRIPFAAARDGNFPAWFGVLHPKHRIPMHSLLTLGGITLLCCIFRLQEVITTLVVVRILFQFLLQGTATLLPKHRQERKMRGFRMPLYPLPVLLALSGFVFILFSRPNFLREMRTAGLILIAGTTVYGLRYLKMRNRT
jgi:amino acid transporter